MKVVVLVNEIQELSERQTTSMLIASLVKSGRSVYLLPVTEFAAPVGFGSPLQLVELAPASEISSSRDVQCFVQQGPKSREGVIDSADVILIRTNPGRDAERSPLHDRALAFCEVLQASGNIVINSPTHLKKMASKAAILLLPEKFRPPMLIDSSVDKLAEFIRDSRVNCVTKPLVGSRGENVCRVSPDQSDIRSFLREQYGGREIVAQHFIESAEPGDKRVVVVDGAVLQIDGKPAGIHRIPSENDFRANLHAGATAAPLHLTDSQYEAAQHAAELLSAHGIRLAGVDLIGDQVIEFNVFSTGGLYFANQFSGVDFADEVVRRLL